MVWNGSTFNVFKSEQTKNNKLSTEYFAQTPIKSQNNLWFISLWAYCMLMKFIVLIYNFFCLPFFLSCPHQGHPEDIYPMVLTTATQEHFDCRADEDVTGENPYKLLKKDDIIQDIKMRAAVSDFSPVKQTVLVRLDPSSYRSLRQYPQDTVMMHRPHDKSCGNTQSNQFNPELSDVDWIYGHRHSYVFMTNLL